MIERVVDEFLALNQVTVASLFFVDNSLLLSKLVEVTRLATKLRKAIRQAEGERDAINSS